MTAPGGPPASASSEVNELISRLQAALDATYPGHWQVDEDYPSNVNSHHQGPRFIATTSQSERDMVARTQYANAAFIATAHNAMPALLSALAALVAERDEAGARVAEAIDQISAEHQGIVINHVTVENASPDNTNGETAYFSGKRVGLTLALDILKELVGPLPVVSQSGDAPTETET